MAVTRTSLLTERLHQFRSGDAALDGNVVPAGEPNQRHSVWNNQTRLVDDSAGGGGTRNFAAARQPGDGDVISPPAARDPLLNLGDGVAHLNAIHANPYDLVP